MKKKLLIAALMAAFASSSAFATDTATDNQAVTITVPEINLIDIATAVTIPALTLDNPDQAGSGFGTQTATTTYDFSGNTAANGSSTNKITVEASSIPTGGKLVVESAALGGGTAGSASTTGLTSSARSADLLTGIGNVAQSNIALTYTFGPSTPNGMVGFTAANGDVVTLTYTISNG